jgi:hypothetical protein
LKNKKIILPAFDYEVFLFKSGTPEKCIIEPTEILIKKIDENNIRSTFFVDTIYLQKLINEPKQKEQLKKIKEQLQTLVLKKQRIELHLHPTWLDACYENNHWVFPDQSHYRLESLNKENVLNLFNTGVSILNDIARDADSDYKVRVFRAGGLCIEPFLVVKDAFLKNEIFIDSSTAFGTYELDGIHKFDFRNIPDKEYYKFSEETGKEDANGLFYEIPITTYKNNFFDKFYNKVFHKLNNKKLRIYGDGEGLSMGTRRTPLDKVKRTSSMFSLEDISPKKLVNKVEKSEKNVITFISHPKLLSEMSFLCLDKLVQKGYSFETIYDFVKEIET